MASCSLVSWKLMGKGMCLKGWGNIAWARWFKGNFNNIFWLLLTKSSLSTFTQVKKMSFGNLYHQSFTKDHQIFLMSHRLQRSREGIKQGISFSSSIPGKYSKTVLLHTTNPTRHVFLSHLRKGFSRYCNWINSWGTQLPFTVGSVSTSIPACPWQGLSRTWCKIGRIVSKV